MNNEIIKEISLNLNVKLYQVEETLKLLGEGSTIPFIARYRKERTGNLDEEQIRSINEVYEYQVNLLKRKNDVIRLIDEKNLLTEEIKANILNATKLVEVEDIYRPYKEKKKTKATEAIANGLEGLAKIIMSFPLSGSLESISKPFLSDKVKTIEDAIQGSKYIISEWTSDNASYRKWIRNYIYKYGVLYSSIKKNSIDEEKIYEIYYEYSEEIKNIKPHRVLALNRGEKEGVLSVSIKIDNNDIIKFLESKIIRNEISFISDIVKESILDSYKRLIFPSIEREIRSELSSLAEESAISNFAQNLEKLLLTPPIKDNIILGLDPAFRTGCKLAVIDNTGKVLNISVIYPHEPQNKIEESKKIVLDLIEKYKINIIAIGNGTASRESEEFISKTIKDNNLNIKYVIVSEAGASVYSASKLAISEFPDLQVEQRSAISIGRRLQDPLSELVKVDPKSIGVGLYQHDVQSKKLSDSLDFTVSKVVNQVGVNINTASVSLLKYISGLNQKLISKIIETREKKGKIKVREELKKILPGKSYEQSIGFLRIVNGSNPLDSTSIHPESYETTNRLLSDNNMTLNDIGSDKVIKLLDNIIPSEVYSSLDTDIYTLTDIIESLKRPNRDPRDEIQKPILRSDILKIEDLKLGMKLQGTVRNVVDFGVFIDIGLKNDALAHISKLSNKYIKHPSEILSVGDIIDVYVDEILPEKKKVSLSLVTK